MGDFARRSAMVSRGQPSRQDAEQAGEKRFAPRRAGHTPAIVTFDGAMESYACVIRDMSATGARLEFRQAAGNPFFDRWAKIERISLLVRMDRVTYDCRILRRTETELGVRFMAPPKAIPRPVR